MFITTINGKEYKVFFKHGREERAGIQKDGKPGISSHPVDTTCYFVDKATEKYSAAGYTKCNPKEHFQYNEGRKYALERAMDALNLTRKQRGIIWMDYHARTI